MPKRVRTGPHRLLASLVATALLVPGCKGVTGPDEPKRATIGHKDWTLDPFDAVGVDVSITGVGTGTLEATVEWTFGTNDVDVYVTATGCTPEMFASQACSYRVKADSQTTKPERVSYSVSAGDNYRFWIVNFGPQRESGTFEAILIQ
jgi:hypothetical protein